MQWSISLKSPLSRQRKRKKLGDLFGKVLAVFFVCGIIASVAVGCSEGGLWSLQTHAVHRLLKKIEKRLLRRFFIPDKVHMSLTIERSV